MELKTENFTQVLSSHSLVLVDFWAPWCAPCRILGPIVEALAGELAGKVLVAKVNIDEEFELAKQLGISSIPTLILFKDGKASERMVGVVSREQILNMLQGFYKSTAD